MDLALPAVLPLLVEAMRSSQCDLRGDLILIAHRAVWVWWHGLLICKRRGLDIWVFVAGRPLTLARFCGPP